MDIDLLEHSKRLNAEADQIIARSNFTPLFAKLGEVSFVGSYALDLLYRPDIDVFVTNTVCTLDLAIEQTKILLDTKAFQTVGFANHLDYPFPGNWRGLYWELKVVNMEKIWKFDVWYTPEWPIRSIEAVPIIKQRLQANPEYKLKILEKKQSLFNGEKYKDHMNGFKIYESVLGKIF